VEDLKIRFATPEDKKHLVKWWLEEKEILKWFPMSNEREVEDAANICMSYSKVKAVLIAEYQNEVCGIANLYLQMYQKFAHHALFAVIVSKNKRGKGIGTVLMEELLALAKERFNLKMLNLEVYDGNPAISLYQRLGFEKCGYQKNFIKEPDGTYLGKILMQKKL